MDTKLKRSRIGSLGLFYVSMLAVAIVLFFVIQNAGSTLVAPVPEQGASHFDPQHQVHKTSSLAHVLVALSIIILTARLLGAVFRRLGQPPVIGEVIAGILLGPSFLGLVWPSANAFLLPETSAPLLQIIAQIGMILFMFLVGLEMDTRRLREESHSIIFISHASIVVPFLLGATLALWVYPNYSTQDVPFTVFALFMGVSMSVTAFPVLARILSDRGIQGTALGTVSLTCAAVGDASAWCLLAFVVSTAKARTTDAFITVALVLVFVAVMIWIVRPYMRHLVRKTDLSGHLTQDVVAVVVVALLLAALTSEAIGIHALFGSFLLGAIIAHDSLIAHELQRRLNDIVVVLFLPAFFAYTGMRTQIGLLGTLEEWIACLAIIVVACLGKFGGSALSARMVGVPWRGASALGILMNTRGLMEVIVLNIGVDMGVLGPKMFAMLVIMAVVTTFMTSPILKVLLRGRDVNAIMGTGTALRQRAT